MPLAVYLQVALATFLWGTAFPAVKFGLHYVPPVTFAGLRFSLAGSLLLIFSVLFERGRGNGQDINSAGSGTGIRWGRVMLIGTCSTAIFYGMFFKGMHLTSASSGAVVDSIGPVVNAIMAHFILHNDRLTWRKLLAIVIAFSGIAVISLLKSSSGASGVNPIGCAYILGGLIVGSCGTMLVITYRGRLSLIQLTGFQMCLGGALLLLASRWIEPEWRVGSLFHREFLATWFYLALVSAVAFRLWYGLVRRYKVTSLSVYSFLTGMWGAVLSIVFLKEPITWPLMLGLALVVTGVIIMNRTKSAHIREIPPETTP